jgi:hypothetical protein
MEENQQKQVRNGLGHLLVFDSPPIAGAQVEDIPVWTVPFVCEMHLEFESDPLEEVPGHSGLDTPVLGD